MHLPPFLARLLAGLLITLPLAAPLQAKDQQGNFDFYVLSLSWSPDHCASKADAEQCGRGYGFVLHGLWPQYQRGFPTDCSNESWDERTLKRYAGLYPSSFLARHEWKKHGTCSGLSQPAYHELAQTLKNRLVIPESYRAPDQPLRRSSDALRREFVAANPDLPAESITLSCSVGGRFLKEMYVCFDRLGTQPQACSIEMRQREDRLCGQLDFVVRSVR
ncbi:ribonuclease T2 [Aeromonas sp. RU39B]|uniref:ribonuclease T2 family protein n=1 Tax=Aeromonas sp. RU39B TaxID=1907416 RepID=UPI0009560B09|nr:ribonuclease T2 [Aeromonas sp. RU39B]